MSLLRQCLLEHFVNFAVMSLSVFWYSQIPLGSEDLSVGVQGHTDTWLYLMGLPDGRVLCLRGVFMWLWLSLTQGSRVVNNQQPPKFPLAGGF